MRNVLISGLVLVSGAAFGKAEDRDVPAFSAVYVSAGMRADIAVGPQKPVHIEANADLLPLIETVVEDGALKVRFRRDTHWMGDRGEVRLTIQTPQLHGVGASGGSIVRAQFTRADGATVQASGGSQIHVRGADATKISAQASGGSILELSGSADSLSLQLSGGSQLHGRDFSARNADVQQSGGSEAELKVTGNIHGALSGGSQLHATGGARTTVATSGGSEVRTD